MKLPVAVNGSNLSIQKLQEFLKAEHYNDFCCHLTSPYAIKSGGEVLCFRLKCFTHDWLVLGEQQVAVFG